MKPSEVVITIKPKLDTEALEILRTMHLRMAADIQETIERISDIGVNNEDDESTDQSEG